MRLQTCQKERQEKSEKQGQEEIEPAICNEVPPRYNAGGFSQAIDLFILSLLSQQSVHDEQIQ